MLFVLGLVPLCGMIVLEVSVTMRSRGAVIEAREEAEDWRTVAENLSAVAEDQFLFVRWPEHMDPGYQTERIARVTTQLNACREAYPR